MLRSSLRKMQWINRMCLRCKVGPAADIIPHRARLPLLGAQTTVPRCLFSTDSIANQDDQKVQSPASILDDGQESSSDDDEFEKVQELGLIIEELDNNLISGVKSSKELESKYVRFMALCSDLGDLMKPADPFYVE